jgi:hypothetical protein
VSEPETEAARRQRDADPFIIGLTQHAIETGDIDRLADLIDGFLNSNDQAMRDAFIMALARSENELTPHEYAAALQRVRERLHERSSG